MSDQGPFWLMFALLMISSFEARRLRQRLKKTEGRLAAMTALLLLALRDGRKEGQR